MKNEIMHRLLIPMSIMVLFTACSRQQSLQQYYVAKAENPNFLSVDLPVSLLNVEKTDLSPEQRETLESLRKMNVLAFKKTKENEAEYQTEKTTVKAILDNARFTELMKVSTPFGKGTLKYLGDEDAIDEVVIYGDKPDQGFMLVRVLGNDMNPAHLVQLMEVLQKSDYKGEGLEKIGSFFDN